MLLQTPYYSLLNLSGLHRTLGTGRTIIMSTFLATCTKWVLVYNRQGYSLFNKLANRMYLLHRGLQATRECGMSKFLVAIIGE
jgi:hypothetical protein